VARKLATKQHWFLQKNRFSHRAKVSTAFNVLTPTKSMKENDEQSTMMLWSSTSVSSMFDFDSLSDAAHSEASTSSGLVSLFLSIYPEKIERAFISFRPTVHRRCKPTPQIRHVALGKFRTTFSHYVMFCQTPQAKVVNLTWNQPEFFTCKQ